MPLKVGFVKQTVDEKEYIKVVVSFNDRDLFNLKLDYSQKQVIESLITDDDLRKE